MIMDYATARDAMLTDDLQRCQCGGHHATIADMRRDCTALQPGAHRAYHVTPVVRDVASDYAPRHAKGSDVPA